jgi:hypothetical protein
MAPWTSAVTNGSGLASCAGPVPSGAGIDTSTPDQKTFTVTARDLAGNAATLTRTYKVVAPTPPRITASVSFGFAGSRGRLRFRSLSVKGVPKGATVSARCTGKRCPERSFTKRNAKGTVVLKPFLRRPIRAGTRLTVSVTKAGAVGLSRP